MTGHTRGPWRCSESWHPRIGKLPLQEGERTDRMGNVFWGYSISGCDERGTPILPTLAAVHNFPGNIHANARLIAAAPDLLIAAKTVLDGLHARIEAAPLSAVPVFDGIADLHDAISRAEGRSQ